MVAQLLSYLYGIFLLLQKAESNRLVVGLKYMTEEKYDDQIKYDRQRLVVVCVCYNVLCM